MPSDDRLSELKRQIRQRLMKVCSHMSQDDFERLVEKVALNQNKGPAGTSDTLGYTWKAGTLE